MTLIEMQILFQTIIEETHPDFFDKRRPDSYDILKYLNQASLRYVQKKYLPYPTFKENLAFVNMNIQDMSPLIKTRKLDLRRSTGYLRDFGINDAGTPHSNSYGGNAKIFDLPEDFMFILGANYWGSRQTGGDSQTPLRFTSNEYQECHFVAPDQLQRYMSTPINRPVMREPMVLMREPQEIVLFYDDYTGDGSLYVTYLRRPFILSYDYAEYDTLLASMIGENVRVLPGSRIYYPANGIPSNSFYPGEEIRVLNGYYTMWSYPNTDHNVGYPSLETNQSELPEYMHEDIVRLAVQMLLDEARFRLMPKQKAEA